MAHIGRVSRDQGLAASSTQKSYRDATEGRSRRPPDYRNFDLLFGHLEDVERSEANLVSDALYIADAATAGKDLSPPKNAVDRSPMELPVDQRNGAVVRLYQPVKTLPELGEWIPVESMANYNLLIGGDSQGTLPLLHLPLPLATSH